MERLVFTLVIIATFGCYGQGPHGHQRGPQRTSGHPRPQGNQTILEACYFHGSTDIKICFHYHNLTRTKDEAEDICRLSDSKLLNSDNYNKTLVLQNFGHLLRRGIWFEKFGFDYEEESHESHEAHGTCLVSAVVEGRVVQAIIVSYQSCHVLCVEERFPETVTKASMQMKDETTNVKLIIGITVGIVACIAMAIIVIVFLVQRRLKNAKQTEMRTATDPEHRVSNEYEQISNHPPVYSVPHQNRRQNDSGDVKGQEVNVDDVRLYDNPAYNQI